MGTNLLNLWLYFCLATLPDKHHITILRHISNRGCLYAKFQLAFSLHYAGLDARSHCTLSHGLVHNFGWNSKHIFGFGLIPGFQMTLSSHGRCREDTGSLLLIAFLIDILLFIRVRISSLNCNGLSVVFTRLFHQVHSKRLNGRGNLRRVLVAPMNSSLAQFYGFLGPWRRFLYLIIDA